MSLNRIVRRPELLPLTGIRAFAAWWVVMFHMAYTLPSLPPLLYWFARLGFLGVDLFFVLSGFIISYNYWQRFSTFSFSMYRSFLWARLARLYPVHIFTLIVSALLLLGVRVSGRTTTKDFSTWTPASFLANVVMVHAWLPHFLESWNNASWSVSCEWFAYLVFPLLVLIRLKRLPLSAAVLCATVLPAIPAVLVQVAYLPPFFLLIKVVCEFAAGCLMFHVYPCRREYRHTANALNYGVVILLTSMLILMWQVRELAHDCLALIFPLAILALSESSGTFGRLIGSRIALYWGRVSYSLYMTHNVTLWILKALSPVRQEGAGILQFSIYIASISAVAIFTYHFVEEPCRKWMRAQGSPAAAVQPNQGDSTVPRIVSNGGGM
jgi:peptidoglycan/LPS O-acetylase OafA/YrhL